jgi:hypothetical protein
LARRKKVDGALKIELDAMAKLDKDRYDLVKMRNGRQTC